jgi:hypothetical protein
MGKPNQDEKESKEKQIQEAKARMGRRPDQVLKNGTDDEEPVPSHNGPQHPLSATEEKPELDADLAEVEAKNVTICAPQVVHFGRDGDPLWFNGWILLNKFDKKHTKAGDFEMYMKEPREITEPEAWKLGEHNMCCLTGYNTFSFTKEEQETLRIIIEIAKDVGAYDQE